ncbi:MAG TPA: methyltransferase [Opitutaceae bacterium]|jgi:protein-S-isoprenylcysteine O-methyltransferase Ste14|nr:methyltransferase [Opitutaceae bacterium]
MRATDFEFRWRFILFGLIFGLGFNAYALDHVNLANWLEQLTGAATGIWLVLGAALTAAAAALRTWATAYLRTDVVHDLSVHDEKLVADGPYRHCRNPLYLGGVLLAAGMGVFASRLGFAVMGGGILLLNTRLIAREEAELAASQGASFAAYCRAVPRLLPSLASRLPAGGTAPRWTQAMLGESWIWLMAAGAWLYIFSHRLSLFIDCIYAGLAVYVVMLLMLKVRRSSAP